MISIRRDPVVTCTSILTAAVTSKIILAAAAPFVERARMRNGSNLDVWSAILSYYPCGRPMRCCDPNLTYLGNGYTRSALLFVEFVDARRRPKQQERRTCHTLRASTLQPHGREIGDNSLNSSPCPYPPLPLRDSIILPPT